MKIYEIQTKYKAVGTIQSFDPIQNPKDICKYMNGAFDSSPMQEHFFIILLNSANVPLGRKLVSIGLINQAPIHCREVFRTAIIESATNIICVHNHPSGNIKPSTEDIEATKKLCEAGKLLGIDVLDHLIISEGLFYSIRANHRNLFN